MTNATTEDFRRGVSGNIYAYETPEGNAADYAKAVHILTVWEDGRVVRQGDSS